MIIDGTNLLLGRLATFAAKKALEGEEVIIINSEKVVISGKKPTILKKYKERRARGEVRFGPFFPKRPDRILKRTIRGMLPYKKKRGRDALSRVKCFIGVPDEIDASKAETIKDVHVSKIKRTSYVSLRDISKELGAKIYEAQKSN